MSLRPRDVDDRGFSLLELVIVVAIAGALLALSVPGYVNQASNQRALNATQALVADLHAAQQEAVTRRAVISVVFSATDPACASYVISSPSGVIKRTCLPSDIQWAPVPSTSLAFQPLGAPEAGMTVTLRSTRTGQVHTVIVSAQGGVITDDTR